MGKITKRAVVAIILGCALIGGGFVGGLLQAGSVDGATRSPGPSLMVSGLRAAGGSLKPGDEDGKIFTVTISNLDEVARTVTSFDVRIVNPDGSPWTFSRTAGLQPCTGADFDIWTATEAPVGSTVPAATADGPGRITATFHVSLHDQPWDQFNCLRLPNNTVPLHVTVS